MLFASFLFLLFVFAFSGGTGRAFAAESSVIESVEITFKDLYGEQEEILTPDITTKTKGAFLSDVTFQKDVGKWVPGKRVRVKVQLSADEGRHFSTKINHSTCKVTGAVFDGYQTDREDHFTVWAYYTPVSVLGDTEKAGWNAARTKAIWTKVPHAPGYRVELYADDKKIKSFNNVRTSFLDLAEFVGDTSKIYYYEVKAIPLTSDEKKYLKEGNFVLSVTEEFPDSEEDEGGDEDGDETESEVAPRGTGSSTAYDTWRYVEREWYYIDSNGQPVVGWLYKDGNWYYMDRNGAMCTGWWDTGLDGRWCFFAGNGVLQMNTWIQSTPGSWYHVDVNGYMQTGWYRDSNGFWYWLDPVTGRMQIGWILLDGSWYYFNDRGEMHTGWLLFNKKWYYLAEDGKMLFDTTVGEYQFGSDGALVNSERLTEGLYYGIDPKYAGIE